MKHLIKLRTILSVGLILAYGATTAHAQVNTFTFDENGKGFFNGAAIPGVVSPFDPSGGVAGAVLIYTVPAALTIGDVLIAESISPGVTNVSDVVRFFSNNQVIFYSEQEATGNDGDLADISGLPREYLQPPLLVFETGTEGNNGAVYHATPGQPGWDGNALGTDFQFISDVPEPGSLAVTIVGGTLLVCIRRLCKGRS